MNTQEQEILDNVAEDAKRAVALGQTGLATPQEIVDVKIFAVLKSKDADGKPYVIPTGMKLPRPKGADNNYTYAQAWSHVAQAGGVFYTDTESGLFHIFPLTSIDHLEVKAEVPSGIVLA